MALFGTFTVGARGFRRYGALLQPTLWFAWLRVWKGLPEIRWMLAAHHFRNGNYRLAAEFYKAGLVNKQHPAFRFAQLDLAYCLFRLRDPDASRIVLKEILASEQRLRDAYLLLAEIELLFGDHDTAETVLKNCLYDFPDDFKATLLLAQTVFSSPAKSSQFSETLDLLYRLREARQLDDAEMPSIDMLIAQYQLFYGDSAKGEKQLARVLAHEASPLEASLLRAEWLLEQGRTFQAQVQLGRVAERMPLNPRPLALLARSYLIEGALSNFTWALNLAQTACQLSSYRHPEYLEILAAAYEANHEDLAALLILEKLKGKYQSLNVESNILAAFEDRKERLRISSSAGGGQNLI